STTSSPATNPRAGRWWIDPQSNGGRSSALTGGQSARCPWRTPGAPAPREASSAPPSVVGRPSARSIVSISSSLARRVGRLERHRQQPWRQPLYQPLHQRPHRYPPRTTSQRPPNYSSACEISSGQTHYYPSRTATPSSPASPPTLSTSWSANS